MLQEEKKNNFSQAADKTTQAIHSSLFAHSLAHSSIHPYIYLSINLSNPSWNMLTIHILDTEAEEDENRTKTRPEEA